MGKMMIMMMKWIIKKIIEFIRWYIMTRRWKTNSMKVGKTTPMSKINDRNSI